VVYITVGTGICGGVMVNEDHTDFNGVYLGFNNNQARRTEPRNQDFWNVNFNKTQFGLSIL